MGLPAFLLALGEALATASAATQPRMTGAKNSRMLSLCELEIERAANTGGGTVYGVNFGGPNNTNRQDFVGDGSTATFQTTIAYAALANNNWLCRVDRSARTGTVTTTVGSTTVTGSGTAFTTELTVGDEIIVNGERHVVTAIASTTSLTVDSAFQTANAGVSILLADAVLVPTTDFTVSNVGGFALITLGAAAKLGSKCTMQVHLVVPVAVFTFATATTIFARREVQGYDVMWYVADATASPSATNLYVSAIGE